MVQSEIIIPLFLSRTPVEGLKPRDDHPVNTQEAGFIKGDSSELRYRYDNELRYDTVCSSVNDNFDQILPLFRQATSAR